MDLFDQKDNGTEFSPLADRMRPRTLADFVGQPHLLGKDSLLNLFRVVCPPTNHRGAFFTPASR